MTEKKKGTNPAGKKKRKYQIVAGQRRLRDDRKRTFSEVDVLRKGGGGIAWLGAFDQRKPLRRKGKKRGSQVGQFDGKGKGGNLSSLWGGEEKKKGSEGKKRNCTVFGKGKHL